MNATVLTGLWFDADHPAGAAQTSGATSELEQQALDQLEECINAARSVY